ncbi:MAG: protein kinase, partial [Planctomycetes bacterium]|nr:protein kinase [Planctomycetota bacterium]
MSETRLIGYVREALEILERGEDVDVRVLCREDPDLAPAVAEALGLRTGLGDLHAAAERHDPFEGRVLDGRYELVDCLGRGAMGVVYRATDRELERTVAVKLFSAGPGRTSEDEQRFVREALVLASVEDDHVVRVFDRGATDAGELYVVMECLSGLPLSDVLQACCEATSEDIPEFGEWSDPLFERRPTATYLRTVVRWIADVAQGLAAAHAAGVFHRDVKPSNIFIKQDLEAVLLDFGIATRSGDAALTATNTSIGTPWYMAPEQVTGGGRGTATADVYGLAATLYHMLALRPPFSGTAAQVFAAVQHYDPQPIGKFRPDLPRDLVAIVEHGMERTPSRRYQSIAAMEADLRAFLDHRPVSVRPLRAIERAIRRMRRRPARAIATASTAALVPIIGVSLWLGAAEQARRDHESKLERIATLPFDLAVEDAPAERLHRPARLRRANLAKLDAIVQLDPGDFAYRTYRAAIRLDEGMHEGAAADMRAVAQIAPSAFLRSVVSSFENADRSRAGHLALQLELTEPVTAHDAFVAGFLELRGRERGYAERAVSLLTRAADALLAARDLRLVAVAAYGEVSRDAEVWQRLFEDARSVIEAFGRNTSRALAAQGISMIARHQYDQAVALLQDADELCPDQYGIANNLGQAYRKRNLLAAATEAFERAAKLRPTFWRTHYQLALVQRDRNEFDAARATAAAMPIGDGSLEWRREYTLGLIADKE